MKNSTSINVSSQIHQPLPPATNSFSIESLDSSVQNFLRSWYRRKTWRFSFNSPWEDLINRAPWRTKLANFLESNSVHVIAILLLLLDLIITILELSSSLLKCAPKTNKAEEVWYHWAGIAILSVLSGRTVALALGLGSSFFRRPGNVVDGAVVIGALVLEVFLARRGGGLLVVVSLWRVVRVVESAFELSDEAIEALVAGIVYQFEALREENRRLLEAVAERDKMIEKLRDELDQ
ncbi:hypothetical protein F2P56_027105 [Juglans regia]|uniref:Voltage-gated hydrogen channel 1 n=2 Tax=Juglans regia TaxID=51240 RepID=A0A833UHL8_JUGRE|nr:voltage-gated hydrogen channel 1 [Juglans regia]KAF5452070.1 hypothetical protein F2P56_027105 [Juglans regia]